MLGLMGICCNCCENFKDYHFFDSKSNILKMNLNYYGEYYYGYSDFFSNSYPRIPFFQYHPYRLTEVINRLKVLGFGGNYVFPLDISTYRFLNNNFDGFDKTDFLHFVCGIDSNFLNFINTINNHFFNSLARLKSTCSQFSIEDMNYSNSEFVAYLDSFSYICNLSYDVKFRIFYNPETLYFTKIEMLEPSISSVNFTKI